MASQAKRKLTRRPGLAEFARETGVTFSHARRCIIGERQSKKLRAAWSAWQRTRKTSTASTQ